VIDSEADVICPKIIRNTALEDWSPPALHPMTEILEPLSRADHKLTALRKLFQPRRQRKKVQFADLVGRQLEFVKNITPSSSEDNLYAWKSHCDIKRRNLLPKRMKYLSPCFIPPSKEVESFMKRVYSQNVCLENIVCENFVVTGVIRVTNLCFSKEVTVRFTQDSWKTYQDIWANYMSTCSDGKTEKFSFRIPLLHDFKANRFMEFAICYRVWNQEFWDNNDSSNYRVWCLEVALR